MRDTREQLLAEAELLIRKRGHSGFSYGDLAESVGIRKASIHHHFPTKVDLVVALLDRYRSRYDDGLATILRSGNDGIVRIEAYAAYYRDGVSLGLGCLCAALAAELDLLPAPLRDDLAAFLEAHVAWLERVLREGRDNATIAASVDPATTGRMIFAALEGALMMERAAAGPEGFARILSALVAMLRPTASERG